jgi:hypothetical protein
MPWKDSMVTTCFHSLVTDLPVTLRADLPEQMTWPQITEMRNLRPSKLRCGTGQEDATHTKVAVVDALIRAPVSPGGLLRDAFPDRRVLHRKHGPGTLADSSMRCPPQTLSTLHHLCMSPAHSPPALQDPPRGTMHHSQV